MLSLKRCVGACLCDHLTCWWFSEFVMGKAFFVRKLFRVPVVRSKLSGDTDVSIGGSARTFATVWLGRVTLIFSSMMFLDCFLLSNGLDFSTDWDTCCHFCWPSQRTCWISCGIAVTQGLYLDLGPKPRIVHEKVNDPSIVPNKLVCATLISVVLPVASFVAHTPDSPKDGNAATLFCLRC